MQQSNSPPIRRQADVLTLVRQAYLSAQHASNARARASATRLYAERLAALAEEKGLAISVPLTQVLDNEDLRRLGTRHHADYVISKAAGRKTEFDDELRRRLDTQWMWINLHIAAAEHSVNRGRR